MKTKRKLGIVSGMGSRAGAIFLQKVIDYSPATCDQDFLEIILHNNTLVPDRTKAIVYNETSPLNELNRSIRIMEANNVDVIFISCITSYFFYEELSLSTKVAFINPIKITVDYIIKNHSVKRVGVLATTGTIQSQLFHKAFSKYGLEVITLAPQEQEEYFMKPIYMKHGLKSSVISDEAKDLFFEGVRRIEAKGIDMLIGACSELPILLSDRKNSPIPYIDVIDLTALNTVRYCYDVTLTEVI